MAILRAKKNEILSILIENIKNAKSIGFTQINGMTVLDLYLLRKELKAVNSTFSISKKTLIKIAVKEALGLDLNLNLLPGQIGIVCSNTDTILGLSKANAFITKMYNKKVKIQKINWVASIFEGNINGIEETKIIASIPSKEILFGRLLGSMMSPLSSMVRFFDVAAKEIESKGKSKVGELK